MNVDALSEQVDEVSQLLKQLAHPLRLKVLCVLAQGEATVSDLLEATQANQSLMSQFLSRMKAEGLVECRREGSFSYYSISDNRILSLMKSLKKVFCERNPKS